MRQGEQEGPPGRYGLLLATLIAAYLLAAATSSHWGAGVRVAFIAVVVLLALRNARLSRAAATLAAAAAVVGAIAVAAPALSADRTAEGIASLWSGLMLLFTVVVIVNRVVRLDQVTVQSIYAALSAYLLIGLMFASFFGALDVLAPEPFFAHGQPAEPPTLQYFSFTTLTTLGYGDFTAAGNLGRALAVLEALSGQVFLATLVARLVSAYGSASRRKRPPGD